MIDQLSNHGASLLGCKETCEEHFGKIFGVFGNFWETSFC